MKRILLLLLLVVLFYPVVSQTSIDYQHTTLLKALQKAGIKDLKPIKEIVPPEAKKSMLPINGKYFEIQLENKNHLKYLYVGRANTCRVGGCPIAQGVSKEDNAEYFDYFILFDNYFTVQQVKIFNYQASHGQEVTATGWLKQFIGFNGNKKLTIGKEIDSVSGATISVNAITTDVALKTALLKKIM